MNGLVDIFLISFMHVQGKLINRISFKIWTSTEIDTETEAQALINKLFNIAVLVDTQLGQQFFNIAACNRDHEAIMQKIKDDAKSEV